MNDKAKGPASATAAPPEWLRTYLGVPSLEEGAEFQLMGRPFVVRGGIARSRNLVSTAQAQTSDAFAYKWQKRDTFESSSSLARMRSWLIERYGNLAEAAWLSEHGERPLLIDAGCGAGMSGLELLGPVLSKVRYLGIDVSAAVDVAKERFHRQTSDCGFLQADISDLPLGSGSVDLILSEGVLHHTDSTQSALKSLARLLKPGGRFLFYVYNKKGPVREFTDDHIRGLLQRMPPDAAWRAMEPLTKLGVSLGKLNAEIEITEPIDLLQIPAGRISVQRLFYWHVAKMFYSPDLSFDEMNHINYDWYAPANAFRQSPEEVRAWCAEAGLVIEREVVEPAGITVIARRS